MPQCTILSIGFKNFLGEACPRIPPRLPGISLFSFWEPCSHHQCTHSTSSCADLIHWHVLFTHRHVLFTHWHVLLSVNIHFSEIEVSLQVIRCKQYVYGLSEAEEVVIAVTVIIVTAVARHCVILIYSRCQALFGIDLFWFNGSANSAGVTA